MTSYQHSKLCQIASMLNCFLAQKIEANIDFCIKFSLCEQVLLQICPLHWYGHVGTQVFGKMHFHIFWCDVMAQKWVVASLPHQNYSNFPANTRNLSSVPYK